MKPFLFLLLALVAFECLVLGLGEGMVLAVTVGLSLVAAIAPAVIAYRTRPAIILRGV